MSTRDPVRIATRGSDLAVRQAGRVKAELEKRRFDVELVEVETTGDRIRDELIHRLGKTGAFVRALDEEVLDGNMDLAVHSMKDVPTETPEDLVTVAVPERGPPGDLLLTADGKSLGDLPDGATVGTSSLRRTAQLLDVRADLDVRPLRGNVDTRIEKLLAPDLQQEHERRLEASKEESATAGEGLPPEADADAEPRENDAETAFDRTVEEWFDDLAEIERLALEREVETEYDAIVLAEAGIDRLDLDRHVEYERLPPTEFVPAPGQGALAVTGLDSDLTEAVQRAIDHPRSRVETTVERTVLAELGGGCVAPIGVYAIVQGEYVHATVQVYSRDGEESVTDSRDLPIETHVDAARAFAADLADQGAADLIEAAIEATDDGDAERAEE
ncbi:MAG: hydroxymethylbilane synthase [Halobacteriales archaeon]